MLLNIYTKTMPKPFQPGIDFYSTTAIIAMIQLGETPHSQVGFILNDQALLP